MTTPGAVPTGLSIVWAPSGTSACFRFICAMRAMPARAKRSRSHCSISGWRTRRTPATAAIASRVTSSCVGPRPPVRITASARASASWTAVPIRPSLSPTTVCRRQSQPTSASRRLIQDALELTIWPSSSSVPTPMISQRTLCFPSLPFPSGGGPPSHQLRALGGDDFHLQVVADLRGSSLDAHDAVRIDPFAEAAAFHRAARADPLDQHLEPAADPACLHLGEDAVLQLLEPLDPGAGGARGHAPVEAERGGAVLRRVREEGDPVEPGLLEEALELAHVRLALAGEAQDEVGAEGRVRVQRADAAEPPRRMRRSTGPLTCWSERSK